jgi:2-polyprenyl-3-methyl-5-hydroxy-6-metoxy-1,4-benzoquinol methylase
MKEYVGKVELDYSYYHGKDVYSDGDIEDEILELVKNTTPEEYDKVIEDEQKWPILYHLSEKRTNIIEWLPIEKSMSVLEVGSGCGAITGVLANKANHVTCIDLSKKRSLINAYRNKDRENIDIKVGNFQDVEPHITEKYDYITLIGVLEYAMYYIDSEEPFLDFLRIIKKHLKENGRIVIAIENKLGLKYFAGCQEDHIDGYFTGIEGYRVKEKIRTFSKKELTAMAEKVNLQAEFYYPYPDYKFPTVIYSDEYLPKKGELNNNMRNFDKQRMKLYDEGAVFDSIIEEGLFPEFANSFLIIMQEG